MAKLTESAKSSTKMATATTVFCSMASRKEKAPTIPFKGLPNKANGQEINLLSAKCLEMQPRTKGIKRISHLCISLTSENIQETGQMALPMELENFASKTAALLKVFLSKDCEMAQVN